MNPIHCAITRRAARGLLLCGLLLVLGSSGQAEAGIFDWNTNPLNGHEYKLTTTQESWTDAQAEALSVGGYLVTLTSAAEESWFNTVFNPNGGLNAWMGLTDINSTPGDFQWVTGESLSYTNWRGGNPDNIGVEHYVLFFQGVWDNRTNFDQSGPDPNGPHRLKYGVIERSLTLTPAPEPASLTMAALGGGLIALGMSARARRLRALS